jgi:hexosaminidase
MATLKQLGEEKTFYRNCDFYTGGDIGRPLVMPCCEIEDWPEYPWRGMLIDEGRHFFGKETVKHVLKQMAAHKYNILHWHLTEDQGWRIAIDAYPELVKYGAARPCSPVHFARGNEFNSDVYGPFHYTKDEIREIVAYAKTLGIEVVPEIEFPGHIRAALAAYPEFSCIGAKLPRVPRCAWGIEREVLCVGNEDAMKFVEKVLDEVVELFPCEFIHIGGDECPTDRWRECPKCCAKAKMLGIRPEKLQGYVTARFARYLEKKGKKIIGWDEILECEIPKSAFVMSWRGRKGGLKAAKEGRPFVMCPSSHCYFNRSDGNPEDPFTSRYVEQIISLEKVYAFDPAKGLEGDAKKYLLGSQACFWSEVIWNRYDLDWRMWPRACALAEVLWTGGAKKDFGEFVSRLEKHRLRLIQQGVNVAPVYVKEKGDKL